MSRSTRHMPDVPKVWTPKKRDVIDWHALTQVDDLSDVPDLFGHTTEVTPITGGMDGYRSECHDCGTVLAIHDTEQDAESHASRHREVTA